jgi:hypothetical protein
MGRANLLLSVTAQFSIAKIIGNNQNDIGRPPGLTVGPSACAPSSPPPERSKKDENEGWQIFGFMRFLPDQARY